MPEKNSAQSRRGELKRFQDGIVILRYVAFATPLPVINSRVT
jgi:hypothetical protein